MNNYRIAGIDIHKKMLAVVVADLAADGEMKFEHRKFNNSETGIGQMSEWFASCGVGEAVMESTAQYWRTVWRELEGRIPLRLAQAFSNRAAGGRKTDFADAERLVRRLVAGELALSYVPGPEQRLWRTLSREKYLVTRARIQQINGLEAFLEEIHIKLSCVLSDLNGVSGQRILKALAEGSCDADALAALADAGVKATREQIREALAGAAGVRAEQRALLGQFLGRIQLFTRQREEIDQLLAGCLTEHQSAVVRLAEIAGLGVDSAQQIIAEVGPQAAVFNSAAQMASWIGVCPGREESAGVSRSDRSPKGNTPMRRILNQCANAAIKARGSVFEMFYRRKVAQLGHKKTVWAVAHKLARVVWKVLHDGVRYQEQGPRLNSQQEAKQLQRMRRLVKQLGFDPNSLRKSEPQPPIPHAAVS